MDTSGILHSESDIDLFCLHFVGMNLFQRTLDAYVSSWNHHPMHTKSYATPIQSCISGLALLKVRQDAVEFLAPCTELIQVRFYEFVTCNYYFPLPVFVMIGSRRTSSFRRHIRRRLYRNHRFSPSS